MSTDVLIANDSTDHMECIAHFLESAGIRVLISPASDRTLLGLIGLHQPDDVMYDFPAAERNGIPIIEGVTELFANRVKAIAYTDCTDLSVIYSFIAAGGCGYLLKNCSAEEILLAIHRIHAGEKFCCSALGLKCIEDSFSGQTSIPSELIRELPEYLRRILPEIPESNTTGDLARKFKVSHGTMKTYRQQIMDELGVHDWNELKKRLKITILE